jgi:hypothetical protein
MDITSANAIILITAPGVFNTPQRLQKFSAQDIYEMGAINAGETSMGVDGYLSAGFTFVEKEQAYTFQADSESNEVFQQIYRFEESNITKIPLQGITILPALGLKFVSPKGFLKNYTPMPSAGTTAKPLKYSVVWERVSPQPA